MTSRDWNALVPAFVDVLRAVGTDHEAHGDERVTGAGPRRGRAYQGDLMIVGRAVNGWDERGWRRRDALDPQWCEERARMLLGASTASTGVCPLAWVSELWGPQPPAPDGTRRYSTKRSQFWQAARATLGRLDPATTSDPNWPSRLAWSNLYPVAPENGGNPSGRLQSAQFDAAARFLGEQLRMLAPRRSLWMTGDDWAGPFRERLGATSTTGTADGRYVQWVGTVSVGDHSCALVVARHPQVVAREPFVDAVVAAFSSLARSEAA